VGHDPADCFVHPAAPPPPHCFPASLQLRSLREAAQQEQRQLAQQTDALASQLEEARREAAVAHELVRAEQERVTALEEARSAAAQVSCAVGTPSSPGQTVPFLLDGEQ
jgi:hypothetical protein